MAQELTDTSDGRKPGDDTPWLHLRSQFTYHSEAHITGTPEGLHVLVAALSDAICNGRGRASAFASDGEGYTIEVRRTRTVSGLGEPTYLDVEARALAEHERKYLIREDRENARLREEGRMALVWCRLNGNPHKVTPID